MRTLLRPRALGPRSLGAELIVQLAIATPMTRAHPAHLTVAWHSPTTAPSPPIRCGLCHSHSEISPTAL